MVHPLYLNAGVCSTRCTWDCAGASKCSRSSEIHPGAQPQWLGWPGLLQVKWCQIACSASSALAGLSLLHTHSTLAISRVRNDYKYSKYPDKGSHHNVVRQTDLWNTPSHASLGQNITDQYYLVRMVLQWYFMLLLAGIFTTKTQCNL